MQAKYVYPFINASVSLFHDYLGIDVTYDIPFINRDASQLDDVSAIIQLAGETTGAVVLSFSSEAAVNIVSKLSSNSFQKVNEEVIDGVGELVNIIAGNAKKDLLDYRITISLPDVITKHQVFISWPENIPVITIPFQSEFGNFSLNVSMEDLV